MAANCVPFRSLHDSKGYEFITCQQLFNTLQQTNCDGLPFTSDPNYLLLLDCRDKFDFNESHINLAQLVRIVDDEYYLPSNMELNFKQNIVLYDSSTNRTTHPDESRAISCAIWLWQNMARSCIKIVNGGFEDFSRFYPFLRSQKIIWMPREIDHDYITYPFEIVQEKLYQGKTSHLKTIVKKNLKLTAVVCCGNSLQQMGSDLFAPDNIITFDNVGDAADVVEKLMKLCQFIGEQISLTNGRVLIVDDCGTCASVFVTAAFLIYQNKQNIQTVYTNILHNCNFLARPTRLMIEQLSDFEHKQLEDFPNVNPTAIPDTVMIY